MDQVIADVVLGALVDDGEVLLARRRPAKQALPDVWDLPGGCVEDGESELDALARELREELDVRIALDEASQLYRLAAGPVDDTVVVSAWLVRNWQGTPINNAPEEHAYIGWFELAQLPSPADPHMRAAFVNALQVLAV